MQFFKNVWHISSHRETVQKKQTITLSSGFHLPIFFFFAFYKSDFSNSTEGVIPFQREWRI